MKNCSYDAGKISRSVGAILVDWSTIKDVKVEVGKWGSSQLCDERAWRHVS